MGTCTIIAVAQSGIGVMPFVECFVPVNQAIKKADDIKQSNPERYVFIRVYAETNGGLTLTLIYSP